jgi:hypothetical protein
VFLQLSGAAHLSTLSDAGHVSCPKISLPVSVLLGTSLVGFEVLTAVSTKMAVFWVVAPCSLVEVYQRFRGLCCLQHQDSSLQPRRQPSGHFLVRIRIAKCFTNSNKRFRCEVMFENEHTFCPWIHHIRTCIVLRNWREQRPSNKGDLDLNVMGKVGIAYYTGLWFHFCAVVTYVTVVGLRFK